MAALAARQEASQAGLPSMAIGFSHAAAAAAASMASFFPHRSIFEQNSYSKLSSSPSSSYGLVTLNSLDPTSELDGEQIHCFEMPQNLSANMRVQTIGAGLANFGNTCFLNSVLQCLTYTPPLAAHLQSGLHKTSCQVTGFCAMCALERHVKEALASTGRTVSPICLVNNLQCIARSFQMWRQEDAHEYMRYLIEALQKCCSVELSSGGKSLIQSVFGGRLRSQVKCTLCSHCSNTYDPFLDLSLEVVKADSLQKALAHFTAIEYLDGDNKYSCSKCNKKARALKQFTIDKAPPVLTIQLKRFSNLGCYGGKIDKKVHFASTLDLKPFVNGCEYEDLQYSLYAVLVHSGWSTHSGHYYCFVRTARNTWHVMDDSQVSQVSERAVLEQKAYMLFYIQDTKSWASQVERPFHESAFHPYMTADLQRHSSSKTDGVWRDTCCTSSQQAQSAVHSDESSCVCACREVHECMHTDYSLELAMQNGFSESSWYMALKCLNSSCLKMGATVESQSEELGLSADTLSCPDVIKSLSDEDRHKGDAVAQRPTHVGKITDNFGCVCVHEDSVIEGDTRGDPTSSCYATERSEVDEKVGSDANVLPILSPESKPSRFKLFNVAGPIMRNGLFEAAGHILCVCAKFCFWSCFWSPL